MKPKEYRRWLNELASLAANAAGDHAHSLIAALLTDAQRSNRRIVADFIKAISAKIGRGPFFVRLPPRT